MNCCNLSVLAVNRVGHQNDVEHEGRAPGQRVDGRLPLALLQHRPARAPHDARHARLQGHARTVRERVPEAEFSDGNRMLLTRASNEIAVKIIFWLLIGCSQQQHSISI